jgi:antitoxin component of MazEF toxin-antitoxin module
MWIAKRVYTRFIMHKEMPPSGGSTLQTRQLLSLKDVRRWGNSTVVTLSKEVREALNAKVGDKLAFRKVGRFVLLVVVRAVTVCPITEEEIREGHAALGGEDVRG